MSYRIRCRLPAAVLFLLRTATAGEGESPVDIISVNFSTGASTSLTPGTVEGVVAARHWNNVVSTRGRAASGSVDNLVDSEGRPTGASLEFQAGRVNFNDNGKNGTMMNAWAGNGASDSPNAFSFRDLPGSLTAGGYDVLVYYDSRTLGGTHSFSIGERTIFASEPATGQFDGHFTEAAGAAAETAGTGNHVVFRELTAGSFDLVVSAEQGRGAVNGVQIVSRTRPEPPATLPNIVFILADDFGWTDIRSWGSDYYETPHLDRLAEQGMRFPQAYACPNCMPFRAAFLSGQLAPRTGVYTVNNGNRGNAANRLLDAAPNRRSLDLDLVTWAESMRLAGHATGLFGKWHMGGENEAGYPTAQGFEVNYGGDDWGVPPRRNGQASYFADANGSFPVPHLGPNGVASEYVTDRLTTEALDWMESSRHRPFFLYFSHFSVHLPKQAKAVDIAHFNRSPRGERHTDPVYAAMIKAMDDSIGAVMEYLETTDSVRSPGDKLIDNTIVVFYSDNGGVGGYRDAGVAGANEVTRQAPLKSGKGSLYEGGIRVPFIIRWDGHTPPATFNETPVCAVDWYPTFLELASLDAPTDHLLDGESLLPLFTDPQATLADRALFWHFPGYTQASSRMGTWRSKPCSVIRRGNWKLHYYYEDGRYELYDLAGDIGETTNLAKARPRDLQRLAAELRAWLEDTDAPLPTVRRTGRPADLPPVDGPLLVRGDCDGSGLVNITDPICVLEHLFLALDTPICGRSSDADADGELDITDSIYLLNYLFLGGAPPTDPFPACDLLAGEPLPGEVCATTCP